MHAFRAGLFWALPLGMVHGEIVMNAVMSWNTQFEMRQSDTELAGTWTVLLTYVVGAMLFFEQIMV